VTKFQVKVVSPGTQVASLVKTLRLVADLGLKSAKHQSDYLHNNAPCVLVAGVDLEVADHAAGLLRESGAEVVVEESSIEIPMLLYPGANQRYGWNWFGGLTPILSQT
jgi:Ribosomal protein L7/L12 C-terminal domain